MNEINNIAQEYNLKIIEDAAHALGAKYYGQPIGSISDFTCFSFQAIKHISTGDGGAISCKKFNDYKEAKKLRWFGIDRANSPMSIIGERDYNLNVVGYKYHLNNLAASLGLANLEDLDQILSRRKEIANEYLKNLKDVNGIELLQYDNRHECAWWLFTLKVQEREGFIKKLKSKNIPASVVHIGIHKNQIFKNKITLENQSLFDKNQISIPIHSALNSEMVDYIITAIKEGW
jgi:perosamine synthetase